jgi:hypothetical protein
MCLSAKLSGLVAAVLVLAVLPVQGLRADTRLDVWALIHAGQMDAVRARLDVPDLDEQRRAFAAFGTADPVVADFSARLLADDPADARAMTARGWALQAQGWAIRGEAWGTAIHPEGATRMAALHHEADGLARAALAADPGLIPASDLIIDLSRTLGPNDDAASELARVMAITPNRQTLILAGAAMAPRWGGSILFGAKACDDWAARIPDIPGYSPQVCRIDLIYAAGYPEEMRTEVMDQLLQDKSPVLDEARKVEAARSGFMSNDIAEKVFEISEKKGLMTLSDYMKWDGLAKLSTYPDLGPHTAKALPSEVLRLRAEADFNPGSSLMLMLYLQAAQMSARETGASISLEEINARFEQLFAIAPYEPDSWLQFAMYVQMYTRLDDMPLKDIERIRGYYINAVNFSNNNPQYVDFLNSFNRQVWTTLDQVNLASIDATDMPAYPRDEYNAHVVCPTVRSTLVMLMVCPPETDNPGCFRYPPGGDFRMGDLTRAKKRQACEAEFAAATATLLPAPAATPAPQSP